MCSSPIFSLTHKFSCQFQQSSGIRLWPLSWPWNLDGVSCKAVPIPGNTFLWSWSGVIVLMLRHHTHKTVLTGIWRKFSCPCNASCKSVSIPGPPPRSPVLVRRYRAHAAASHAQDCPDWELERPTFPWGSSINMSIPENTSLWFGSGVIVIMLQHHTHKTVLTGSWRELSFPKVIV